MTLGAMAECGGVLLATDAEFGNFQIMAICADGSAASFKLAEHIWFGHSGSNAIANKRLIRWRA